MVDTLEPLSFRPSACVHDLIVQELEEETLIFDPTTYQAHCLNRVAASVWRSCDGTRTIFEITQRLRGNTFPDELPFEEAAAFVQLAVERLGRAALLQEPPPSHPATPKLARRELPTAILIPIVLSIVAPPSTAAASGCGGSGAPCTVPGQCCPGKICCSGGGSCAPAPLC